MKMFYTVRVALSLFFLSLLSTDLESHAYNLTSFSTFLQAASTLRNDQPKDAQLIQQIPIIQDIKPLKNPGPQRDIGLAVENNYLHDIEDFAESYPETDFSADKWDICRMDHFDRCALGNPSFRQRLKEAIAEHASSFLATDISNPFLYLESLGDGLYIIHVAPRFPQGAETEIVAAIIDEDLRVHNIFRIELSSRNGLSTGDTGGYIADVGIVGSARLQDALILAVDALARCGDGKRKLGFLIRFSLKDYTVKWVTPYNTASAKFAVVGDIIYSSDGGSCENDYLYAIDVSTGRVVARDFVPTAFNWVFAENGRLFGQTYGGGFVYRLK